MDSQKGHAPQGESSPTARPRVEHKYVLATTTYQDYDPAYLAGRFGAALAHIADGLDEPSRFAAETLDELADSARFLRTHPFARRCAP